MSAAPVHMLVVSAWPSAAAPERGVFVQRQVEALRGLGHEVRVAPLTDLRTGRLRTPLKYLRLYRTAVRIARRTRPDVVHAHYLLPTGWIARRVARAIGVPLVVTAHGTDVHNAEVSPRIRARTERVVRDAAAVIAVSQQLAERLRALYPGLTVHVADIGVDERLFAPRPEREPHDAVRAPLVPCFVAVGSLLANKNHVRLLEAVARIDGARLVIVGAGPAEQQLRARASELAMGDRLDLPGRLPHEALAERYRAASAACLVSEREGFGLAALEALACGCPVVVSRTAPVAELVEHGVTGAVVDPLDVEDIARGLREAAALPHRNANEVATLLHGRTTRDRARDVAAIVAAAARRDATPRA